MIPIAIRTGNMKESRNKIGNKKELYFTRKWSSKSVEKAYYELNFLVR